MFLSSAVIHLIGLLLWLSACWASPEKGDASPSLDYVARNRATIQRIYDLTVYPNQLPIIYGGEEAVPPGTFGPGARGRISPVGNFTDLIGTVEYFWGLAPVPELSPRGTVFTRADLVSFQSGCPEVASSVVYLYTNGTEQGGAFVALKQVSTGN